MSVHYSVDLLAILRWAICGGLSLPAWLGVAFWVYRDGIRREDDKAILWAIITALIGAIWCTQTFLFGIIGFVWASILAIIWIVLYGAIIRNRITTMPS